MARPLDITLHTTYAELIERAALDRLSSTFPPGGSFFTTTIKGRPYWYFQEPQKAGEGRKKRYVGPDSPELQSEIASHRETKADYRQRREMVSALLRAGLKGPDPTTGKILSALSDAGIFRMRAVVVGTIAYQCYSGLLGTKLGAANIMTHDLDLAQFQSISIAVDDATDRSFEETLKSVDPAFRAVPRLSAPRTSVQYALGTRYRVDILVPNRGPDTDDPMALPALKAAGQPLRFLDYLIYREVRAVALYGGGVLVNVPAPERYALHKLIVSRLRLETPDSQAKAGKDRRQAAELLDVLLDDRPHELQDAWEELLSRGSGWRERAREALELLPKPLAARLLDRLGPVPK